MTPEEITETFEHMATTIRTIQHPIQRDLSGVPEHARPAPVRAKPEPVSDETFKKWMDPTSPEYNPKAAFKAFAEENYGGVLADINARSIRGLYGNFRTQFEDFPDYETDITEALKTRDPATLTEQDVLQTYLTAKGLRQTLKERADKARAKGVTTAAPSAAAPAGAKKDEDLTDLEVEIARKMFRRSKDPIADYKRFAKYNEDGGMSVPVPVGGGKKE